ncbi:ABC transporter substrate-binding protein [Lampropedia cohaerens]|uniref:ABC transporter substrate-binding protein n=1 Tax=Lampropedia cohaerens TaxID=1610491 RepID=A0A0U1PX34_9BURK|nr:ABC transporter substrate-binding protein [Lampropedia cohaerens]
MASVAAAVALAITPAAAVQAQTPVDQLIIGKSMNNVLSLDPAAATGNDVVEIIANLYDFLVELDASDLTRVRPALAERWSIAEDGRQLRFHIRQGVRFHSGNTLTAEDVAWSLQRVLKLNMALATAWKSYGFTADNVSDLITAPEPYIVQIRLPEPTDPKLILYTLATSVSAAVLDRQLVQQHARNDDWGRAWLTTRAAGSGAFTLDEWRAKDVLLMRRNPDYWAGPAKLQRVVMRHMTESQALRLMIERGDIDIATGMSPADITALQGDPRLVTQSVQRGTVYYVAVNAKTPPFADRQVRQAVRALIDYDGINRTIMPHYGVLHQRPVPLGLPATLPQPGYKLDVAKARALLAQAGYPEGFDTTIRVLAESPFINIATSLQSTLAQAGIRASILPGTGNQVYGAMRERQFDIIVGRGGGGAEPHPHSSLRSLVYNPDNRDEARLTNFQGWRTGFQSPRINALIEQAVVEIDADRQLAIYQEIQRIYDEEVGAIFPISQMQDTVVRTRDIRNYQGHPAATTRYHGVYKER